MGDGHRLAATVSPGGYLKEGVKRWWSAALERPGQALRGLGAEVVLDLVDLGAEKLLLPAHFRHVGVVLLLERADLAVHVLTRGVAALMAAPMRALGGLAPAGVAGGHVAEAAVDHHLGNLEDLQVLFDVHEGSTELQLRRKLFRLQGGRGLVAAQDLTGHLSEVAAADVEAAFRNGVPPDEGSLS